MARMGVLHAGGVLLPIDRNLPSQRQRLMLSETGTKTVLHVGNPLPHKEWLKKGQTLDILFVEEASASVADLNGDVSLKPAFLPKINADDPAYIFFTSGTTGVPKGVLGCHKSLSHFLNWQRETFQIGPSDRVAQLTGLSFDMILRDIFLPLTSGGTLCLPEDTTGLGPSDIIRWLEVERITVLHTVPTLAKSWLTNGVVRTPLRDMRWVFFAGEPLTGSLVLQSRDAFPCGEVVNLYGPTETTLIKCFYNVPADVLPGVQPIGFPLPQTQVLIFEGNNQLCGIDEPGEIVIRTPFRSLGYVNNREENKKRLLT